MIFKDYEHLGDNPATDNPKADEKMVLEIFNKNRVYNTTREREIYRNFCYFHGKQDMTWNVQHNRVEEPPAWWRAKNKRIQVNILWPRVMTRYSRKSKLMPIVEAQPNTSTALDKESARVSQKVLDNLRYELRLNRKKREVDFLTIFCSTVVAKICPIWDRDHTQLLPKLNPDGSLAMDDDGEILWDEYPKTKIGFEIRIPLEFMVDDSVDDFDHIAWIMDLRPRDIAYVQEVYGITVEPEKDVRTAKDYLDWIHYSTDTGSSTYTQQNPKKNEPLVLVKEFYEKPSARWDRGRILTLCGQKLAQAKLGISKYWWHPFVAFHEVKNPKRFWGSTPMSHAIPEQDQYNLQISRIYDYIKRMSKGKWLVPKGAGISENVINNANGEFIEFSPITGIIPQQAQLHPLPPHMLQMLQIIQQHIDNIFGVHEPSSRGQMPKNVKTATQAAIINEGDDLRENPQLEDSKDSWEECYSRLLEVFEEFQDEDVEMNVADRITGETSPETVRGSMINGNTRVSVTIGTGLPQSRILRNQQLREDWKAGLFGNPNDPMVLRTVRQMMEFGDELEAFQQESAEDKTIKEENSGMLQGKPAHVELYDDHSLHMKGHLKVLKSKGRHLEPLQHQLLVQHWMDHGKALAAVVNQTAQTYPGHQPDQAKPQLPQGQPGGPPPNSGATVGSVGLPQMAKL